MQDVYDQRSPRSESCNCTLWSSTTFTSNCLNSVISSDPQAKKTFTCTHANKNKVVMCRLVLMAVLQVGSEPACVFVCVCGCGSEIMAYISRHSQEMSV